jgi:uncharacterized phiE125 gp8 family phage protein
MSYSNYIYDFTVATVDSPVSEPVSLTEAKQYCRVTNITEDDLIELMIKAARETIEVATGLSLVSKSMVVYFNNIDGNFEVPFGPINNVTFELFDMQQDGAEVPAADIRMIGNDFPKLTSPRFPNLKATYYGGYNDQPASIIPQDLKIAILDQVSYNYENRGLDGGMGICEKSWRACQRWTRISPIL